MTNFFDQDNGPGGNASNTDVKQASIGRVNIRQAFQQKLVLDYTLPSFLHRTAGVIVAPGSTGKSFLSLQLAMTVALGRDVFDIFDGDSIKAGKVVILNAEDPREIIHQRLNAYGRILSDMDIDQLEQNLDIMPISGMNFGILEKVEMGRLEMTRRFKETAMSIKEIAPRLVILDTLNRMSGGIDENDNAAAGQLMNAVEWLNRVCDCSTLIVHHTNKNATLTGQGSEQQAARGASALTDNARWQLNLASMSRDEAAKNGIDEEIRKQWVRMDFAKVNYGPPRAHKWMIRSEGGLLMGTTSEPYSKPASQPAFTKSGKKDV